jgi:hypothetical protein
MPEREFVHRLGDRILLPPCERCHDTGQVEVTLNTSFVLYLRCAVCGYIFHIPTPKHS